MSPSAQCNEHMTPVCIRGGGSRCGCRPWSTRSSSGPRRGREHPPATPRGGPHSRLVVLLAASTLFFYPALVILRALPFLIRVGLPCLALELRIKLQGDHVAYVKWHMHYAYGHQPSVCHLWRR